MFKNDFMTEGKVTNPKLLDVTLRVCQKVKKYIEKYLVHIKYWQILGYYHTLNKYLSLTSQYFVLYKK